MTPPDSTRVFKRRLLVMRAEPVRLSEFVDEYRRELSSSREEAAFASADLFRRFEAIHLSLRDEICWVAEVLDHTARRVTAGLQTGQLIRYFEQQALNKNKREPFVPVEGSSSKDSRASDAAIYFSPSALTGLIEEHWGRDRVPSFIYREHSSQDIAGESQAGEKLGLHSRELNSVHRLSGAFISMLIAAVREEESRRLILNSKICEKDAADKGQYAIAESLGFIADRLGIRDFPDTDTVARYLPSKRKDV